MCNVILEKYYDRIKAAYEASAFTEGIRPETEDDIKKFEANFASIPSDYRWLLLNLGGCYLVEPWIFDLKELEENYAIFVEVYEEYMSECEHGPVFPIGGLGDGSIVFKRNYTTFVVVLTFDSIYYAERFFLCKNRCSRVTFFLRIAVIFVISFWVKVCLAFLHLGLL